MKAHLLYLGNQLAPRGGAPTSIDVLAPLLEQEGYVVVTASEKKNKGLRMIDMLSQLLRHSQKTDFVLIDTYSTANFWYAYAVAFLCQKLNLKYIPILHGGELPTRLQNSPKACETIFTHSYLNVAPSRYLMKEFEAAGYINLKYIPNSISLKDYPYRERTSLQPKLLWVRAFAEIYQPLLALQTLKLLLKKYPSAELCMVGPEKDDTFGLCRAYAEEHRLPVTFPGRLDKKTWIELSAEYDIFLNTTNIDNTPVSLIEAMALGIPVVSTNVGGIPYLVSDKEEGLLVPPDNAKEMAAAIEEILENPQETLKRTRTARKKVEGFDWEVVKEEWMDILATN